MDRWEQRATSDAATVGRFWPSARHNVGVACGPSGLVVVDLDTCAHGGALPPEWQGLGARDGADVLAILAGRHGCEGPATFTVVTPSGGRHLYFLAVAERGLRNSAGKVGPMIDVRAGGGYVVGPGSVTAAGRYRVAVDCDPVPLPSWLADLADPPRPVRPSASAGAASVRALSAAVGAGRSGAYVEAALRRELEAVLSAPNGQRNTTVHRAAFCLGQLVAAGRLDHDRVVVLLRRAAESVGLVAEDGERRVDASIFGGLTAGARHPRGRAS